MLRIVHEVFSYHTMMNEGWAVRIFKRKVRYRHYFLRYVCPVKKNNACSLPIRWFSYWDDFY